MCQHVPVSESRLPVMKNTRTTTAAGLAIVHRDRLLMVRQSRGSGMRWEIPSGGQEAGETLEEVAVREVFEETEVKASVGPVIATYTSYRPKKRSVVLGIIYRGELEGATLPTPVPQEADGIVAAEFVDPYELPSAEVGALTAAILRNWWQHRNSEVAPWHIELCRDPGGYRGVDSATTELRPIRL